MASLFERSASALLGGNPEAAGDPEVRRLLEALGYADVAPTYGDSCAATRHRASLLKAASGFVRVFQLASPDAPGLVSLGAELDPALADPMHAGSPTVSVSGVGLTVQEAFQACVGEGIEYLSQLQAGDDVLEAEAPRNPAAELGRSGREFLDGFLANRLRPDVTISWYPVTRLSDRRAAMLPADLCLRRPPGQRAVTPPFPLSTGSAAGISWSAAALHGVLELIERDAASLWWRGGARGASIPGDHEAQLLADDLLSRLRQGVSTRRSWLLDITTDVGIPSVAALSCEPGGLGLAFGLAARPTLTAAVRSAIMEMCQIELAQIVVEAKCRERGEAALNSQDRVHRRRATMINGDRCALLQPIPKCTEPVNWVTDDVNATLDRIVNRLRQCGIEAFGLELTRPRFAVPVARIVTPGLQLEPSDIVTTRLADMIARTGGGAVYTGGVALI